MNAADFAAVAVALYAAHHVGDYWVQTDHQAQHKGQAGHEGRINCMWHVLSYVATQYVFLLVVMLTVGARMSVLGMGAALAVSGVTHYLADRREHGIMFWLARRLPGKARFLALGAPRPSLTALALSSADPEYKDEVPLDNPSLGTGAWALDQSWHIFWGVFVAAILAVTL